jgi:hypothetical protein
MMVKSLTFMDQHEFFVKTGLLLKVIHTIKIPMTFFTDLEKTKFMWKNKRPQTVSKKLNKKRNVGM